MVLIPMSQRHQKQIIQSTYYDVLGVTHNASDTDIKLAYRQLVMYWHPDKRVHNPYLAEQNLKIINEAYSHLKTRAARSHYDQLLQLQQKMQRLSSSPTAASKWGQFWNWLTMLESHKK